MSHDSEERGEASPLGDAQPGPLLTRALHAFDHRLGPGAARVAGLMLAVVAITSAAAVVLAGAGGVVFALATGTDWLRRNVTFFEERPRAGAATMAMLTGCSLLVAFLAGRASAVRGRTRGRHR